MIESSDLRLTRMPLNNGAATCQHWALALSFPTQTLTRTATRDALDAGFRHFDCAERYRNEQEVGEALQVGLAAAGIAREDIFVTTKLWNTNHRPERVETGIRSESRQTQASSIWISTSFILHLHFNRETTRTREIKTATSSTTTE